MFWYILSAHSYLQQVLLKAPPGKTIYNLQINTTFSLALSVGVVTN